MRVLISSIDTVNSLPYQWALLKTYADAEPWLKECVDWSEPFHSSRANIKDVLQAKDALAEKFRFDELDVLGISCYVWNREDQFTFARMVKERNPRCLVVAGGPELRYKDPNFFNDNPYIDVLVKRDGEIPFRKILLDLADGKRSFDDIPGLVLPNGDTGPSEVLKEFELSPWLHNREYLEKDLDRLKKRGPVAVFLETNRGCPYSCTYCNWGSSTMSKLRLFKMENIREEIRWFSKIGIGDLCVTDANFGILERDLEINRYFDALCEMSPVPKVFFYPAKNHLDRVSEIAVQLQNRGLLDYFDLGIQSTDPVTLTAIGRSNMTLAKHKMLVEKLRADRVKIGAALILGCPGETKESWRTSIAEAFELGVNQVNVMPFQMLANAPADDPQYRAKWKIETMFRLGFRSISGEFIRSTASFSQDDYIEMKLYAWCAVGVWEIPEVRAAYNDLRISYRCFFDGVYEDFFQCSNYETAASDFKCLKEYAVSFVKENDPRKIFPVLVLNERGNISCFNPSTFISERAKQNRTFSKEFNRYVKSTFLEPQNQTLGKTHERPFQETV